MVTEMAITMAMEIPESHSVFGGQETNIAGETITGTTIIVGSIMILTIIFVKTMVMVTGSNKTPPLPIILVPGSSE